MPRTQEEWIKLLEERDEWWQHDGNPKRPHALLTSGKHSSGFVDCQPILKDPALAREVAKDLVEKMLTTFGIMPAIDVVSGPANGADNLVKALQQAINERVTQSGHCWGLSPSKITDPHGKKRMIFSPNELTAVKGANVLLCEDTLTTGGSVELVAKPIAEAGGRVLSFELAVVNRSGAKEIGGREIISLVERYMPIWDSDICPLCPTSEAIRPREDDNWVRLNAEY